MGVNINDTKLKHKDIATFEHYKSSWDEIIFDIIDKGETSIFEIQDYFEFDWNYIEWEVFLDALAYYHYVDFMYPNLTIQHRGNYITRKVTITKEEFEEIIKNRDYKQIEKITYETALQELNLNLIGFIKQILPLANCDGTNLSQEQDNLIYNHIARDMVYATESHTHMTLEWLETYCNEHPLQLNNSYLCKLYEIDDLEDFDTRLSKSMLVFGRYKNPDFYYNILDKIMDDENHCVEVLSLSLSPDIKKNYQIVVIYPGLETTKN